jgi:hypothetical protein
MTQPKPPTLGFRIAAQPRVTNEQLHDRLCVVEHKTDNHGLLIAEMKGSVDTLLEFALEDRKARSEAQSLAVKEQGKTERVRLGGRARIMVALFGAVGIVAGAVATVLAGGCS